MRAVVQAALAMAIVACCVATSHAAPQTTVAVDLTALDVTSYQELDGLALEKRIVLRFVQEGFAVVGAREHPDIVLVVRLVDGGLVLEARSAQGIKSREIARHDDSLAELHLEIAQKAAELVRAMPIRVPPVVAAVIAAPPADPWSFESSAGLDVWVRSGGVDLAPRLGLRFGGALAGIASAAVAFSSGDGISVQEWEGQLGGAYRLGLGARMSFEAGALVGALIEHYALPDPTAQNRRGTVVDVIGTIPLKLSVTPVARWTFSVRVAPGLANEGRRHTFEDATIWERGALRIEAGIDAGVRW